jgi:hypothetical protein
MEIGWLNPMAAKRTRNDRTVIAELRRLHSPDVHDLKSSSPDDLENFAILVQAMIGPTGGHGEESFDFTVCTRTWLASRPSEQHYLFGRHYLMVNRYNYAIIHGAIESLCQRVSGLPHTILRS